jgi:hypothetical protein
MGHQEKPKRIPACSHALNRGATDPEGVWADPEAILRPTEGERLSSVIQESENERYPQLMAIGWIKGALQRLPPNHTALKDLLDRSLIELATFATALNMAMDEAHQMLADCTEEPSAASDATPMAAIEEYIRSQLAKISDDDIESAEHAERNTMRLEWYVEKKAAEWIVETLTMLPIDRKLSPLRNILVPTRKALMQRMVEIEEAVGFDMVMASES